MTDRLRKALPVALLLFVLVAAPGAVAAPVTVNLRVEGVADTIFDGSVVTDAHQTTTPTDGVARPCDGTNSGGAPRPTAIGALDDGSKAAGFAWDAGWDSGFGDYYPFLQIGSETIDSSHYLAFYLNWVYANFGGCTQTVEQGDEVLFAHSNFSQSNVLRLSGPTTATTGQSVTVNVEEFDGSKGKPRRGRERSRNDDGRGRIRDAQLRPGGHLPPQGGARRRGPLQRRRAVRRSARGDALHLHRQRGAVDRVGLRANPTRRCRAGAWPAATGARARCCWHGPRATEPAAASRTPASR